MARKTTDKGSKAGSNPSTDETATDAKAGAEQTPAPETVDSKPLDTPPSDDSVTAEPVLPKDTVEVAGPTLAMGPETGSVQEPVTTPEASVTPPEEAVTTPEAAPVLPGPEAPQTPGANGVTADAAGAPEDKSDTVKPAPAAPPASSGGGFLPLVLGGIVAGAIGYGAHYIVSQDSGEQAEEIAALQAEIAQLRSDMPAMPDISALEAELAELSAAMDAPLAEVDALRAEIAADGPDPDLLDQLSADLTDVAARLDALEGAQSDRDSQIAALQDELSEIRDIAENRVAEAEAALDTAMARAGLDMLRAALNAGTPYSDAVALLGDAGVTVPQTIAANAAAGVPTLEMLQETYPDAARAGLRAALRETPAESAGERVANFLRAQTGARSTTPREGDDPDAILSRAGAALEEGALDVTIAELDTLPEAAQAAMADWRRAAQARLEAGAEFETFATTISTQ